MPMLHPLWEGAMALGSWYPARSPLAVRLPGRWKRRPVREGTGSSRGQKGAGGVFLLTYFCATYFYLRICRHRRRDNHSCKTIWNPATRKIRGGVPGLPHGFSGRAGADAADAGFGIQSPDADRNDQRRSKTGGRIRRIRRRGEFFLEQAGGQGTAAEIGTGDASFH